MNLTQPSR